MDIDQLRVVLNTIARRISTEISNPNRGGCAAIAALVGAELIKFTPIEFIVEDDESIDINYVKENADVHSFRSTYDWNSEGIYFNHVLIKVRLGITWYAYDSDGLIVFVNEHYVPGTLTLEEVGRIASSPNGWNYMFNRRQIPKIARIVHECFYGVESAENMSFVDPLKKYRYSAKITQQTNDLTFNYYELNRSVVAVATNQSSLQDRL